MLNIYLIVCAVLAIPLFAFTLKFFDAHIEEGDYFAIGGLALMCVILSCLLVPITLAGYSIYYLGKGLQTYVNW